MQASKHSKAIKNRPQAKYSLPKPSKSQQRRELSNEHIGKAKQKSRSNHARKQDRVELQKLSQVAALVFTRANKPSKANNLSETEQAF